MQEPRQRLFFGRTYSPNFLKAAMILLAVLGMLDKFNILSVNKTRYNKFFAAIYATALLGIALKLFNDERDIPEVAPPNAGLLVKFNVFAQQVTAIRSPQTIQEGAAKGLLCGALLALVLLKNNTPDYILMGVCTFLGVAMGANNQMREYFRPREPQ